MWKFGQNMLIPSQNRCMCFDFTKNGTQVQSADVVVDVLFLFSYFRASLGEILAKMVLFSGKFGEISAKILRTHKNST